MRAKHSMILIPLAIMFFITIVEAPGFYQTTRSSSPTFRRPVENSQLDAVTQTIQNLQQKYGDETKIEFTIKSKAVEGKSHWNVCIDTIKAQLDNQFERNRKHMDMAVHFTEEILKRSKDNIISREHIRKVIQIDPDVSEELGMLEERSLVLGPNLIFVALFLGIVVLLFVMGIQIFGSGLAETTITFGIKILIFFLVWGIISAFSMHTITGVPLVGELIWVILTMIYSMGVFFNLNR